MKIAVMIEAQEGLTWEHWFRIADRVEQLGLDSLWRSDHFFSLSGDLHRPALECWTSLTALAQRTRRIRFGPLVSPMTFRHPALLARMAAAVDRLSDGRLVLGVGAGWNVAEHEAFGIGLPPLKERFDRFEEGIAVIKALWTGGPVDLDGRYYPLRGAAAYPRPQQQPSPPLLIGGDGEGRRPRIVARGAEDRKSGGEGKGGDLGGRRIIKKKKKISKSKHLLLSEHELHSHLNPPNLREDLHNNQPAFNRLHTPITSLPAPRHHPHKPLLPRH